jgi:hypothetical protein
MIQASRLAFGYVGIYDQDEAERVVDMGDAQRHEQPKEAARPELEHYPDDRFAEKFPQWQFIVESGKKPASDIVAMLESKAVLSDDQREQILALEAGVEA